MNNPTKREDILVSICFPDYLTNKTNDKTLQEITSKISELYRYWEVLIIVNASDTKKYEHLTKLINNIRLIVVQHNLQYYQRRVVAAYEAIGDVVVLTSIIETAYFNIPSMIDIANEKGSVVVGKQSKKSLLNPILKTLGLASGFEVSMNYLSTTVYPRTLVNQFLAYTDRQLALRFAPRNNKVKVIEHFYNGKIGRGNSKFDWIRRLNLIQKLFISSASKVLSFVTLLIAIISIAAPFYGFYALIAWLTIDNVQPGWLTTSLFLSFTVFLFSIVLLGISMGVQSILEKLSPDVMDDVVDEVSSMDLFSQVRNDLNVEIVSHSPTLKQTTSP